MILSAVLRESFLSLVSSFSQMRFLFRVVVSGSNCTLVSPGVRLLCNGHFRFGLRIFVVIYPLFFAVGRVVV